MLQFYFLSILLNMITGLVLLYSDSDNANSTQGFMPAVFHDETFRLVLGILTAITGFFKLLTAIRGDVPVVGDLVPALAGLAGGFVLLYEYYRTRSTLDEDTVPFAIQKFLSGKRYVGMVCIAAAALHFLFPAVLFL